MRPATWIDLYIIVIETIHFYFIELNFDHFLFIVVLKAINPKLVGLNSLPS